MNVAFKLGVAISSVSYVSIDGVAFLPNLRRDNDIAFAHYSTSLRLSLTIIDDGLLVGGVRFQVVDEQSRTHQVLCLDLQVLGCSIAANRTLEQQVLSQDIVKFHVAVILNLSIREKHTFVNHNHSSLSFEFRIEHRFECFLAATHLDHHLPHHRVEVARLRDQQGYQSQMFDLVRLDG